jgi:hypothetical protein
MRIAITVPEEHVSPDVVNAALEAVTKLDEQLIKSGQSPTSKDLIGKGAIWRPEPPGDERFDHGGTIQARGWGDCDDWAPLHAASLRTSGEDPGARAIVIPSGPNTYHAIVERSNGSHDDPSIAAGMKPARRGSVSGEEGNGIDIIACDPHDPDRVYQGALLPTTAPMNLHCGPQMSVRGLGRGCFEGRCDLPLAGSVTAPMRTVSGYGRGAVPYALSHTAYSDHPGDAFASAVMGAIQTAEASGIADPDDYYGLVALHGMVCGLPPEHVHAAVAANIAGCGAPVEFADQKARAIVGRAYKMARRFVSRASGRVSGPAAPAAAAWRADW